MPMIPATFIAACTCSADHASIIYQRFQEMPDGCWAWIGHRNRNGYGVMTHAGRTWLAHRLAYSTFVAPIPDGLTIDHLCRNRACVNPKHMEPVTPAENIRRAVRTPRAFSPSDIQHGTAGAYSNHGCRCSPCKAANTARCAEYKLRRKSGFRPGGAA